MECSVVEAWYKEQVAVVDHGLHTTPFHLILWIDRQRKLVLKWNDGTYTETVVKLEINPALPDSEFHFTPPPGATQHAPY